MNTIKLLILAAAVVVGIPLASALAAHQFGSDSLSVRSGAAAHSQTPGEDLCIVNDPAPVHLNPFRSSELGRPGHA